MRRSRAIPTLALAAAVPALAAAATARFAVVYRERAGFPTRAPVVADPDSLGLPWEPMIVPSTDAQLPAWFIPAARSTTGVATAGASLAATAAATVSAPADASSSATAGASPAAVATAAASPAATPTARPGPPRPGVVLVHGWGSNRARMLPIASFLHAAGFHTLSIDVRGHGENPPEALPVTGVVFGEDAAAAAALLRARPDVTDVAILGHSMGGVGAALAAATDPAGIRAVVLVSAPADPRLLVRETFRMADLRLPDLIAQPLAWVSLRSVLRPRGHAPRQASARRAVAATDAAVLVVQGDADEILPLRDLRILEKAAAGRGPGAVTETLVVHGGRHRWLYEDAGFRAAVAGFLARHLTGAPAPADASAAAAAVAATRPPDTEGSLIPEDVHGHAHGDRHAPDGPPLRA